MIRRNSITVIEYFPINLFFGVLQNRARRLSSIGKMNGFLKVSPYRAVSKFLRFRNISNLPQVAAVHRYGNTLPQLALIPKMARREGKLQ
jgi:hypothetical protein